MTSTEISQLAQEHATRVCGEGSKGQSDWMSAADDYCTGFRAAMGLWYENAGKWDAIVAEVHEAQNNEENQYPEDYGYILMNHLGIKDNN